VALSANEQPVDVTPDAPGRRIGTPRPLLAGRIAVLAAILLSSLSLRTAVTSLTPLLTRVQDSLGFNNLIIGVAGMMPTAMFALAGFVSPGLGRRFGLERVALVAAAATVVGIGGRSLVHDTTSFLALSGLALLGMGIGNIVMPPLVMRYFSDRIAMMSTVYITCVQIGTMVPAAIAVPVADAANWQISLAAWAVIPFAAIGPWLWVLRHRRRDPNTNATTTADHRLPAPVWRSPIAWGLAAMFGSTSLITYSMFTWIPKILSEAGASDGYGGLMVSLFSAVGFVTGLVAPTLCARMTNPYPVVIACAACFFGGFAGLLWAPMSGTLIWVILVGMGPTTFPMSLTLINLRTRTGAGSAALSGFVQGVGYLWACAGPLFFGVLHDAVGGWGVPFLFLSVIVLVMSAGAWAVCKPRFLEDTLAPADTPTAAR
jgi:CP family cyanate transporter-like MFS transporter